MRHLSILLCASAALSLFIVNWAQGRAFKKELLPPNQTSEHISRPEPLASAPKAEKAASLAKTALVAAEEVTPPRATVKKSTPALGKTTNVLVVGIDRKPGTRYGGLPDTIIIAAISKEDGHLGLISVPRDLYVEIPDHGADRINASFAVAWRSQQRPLDLLQRVISDTFKLPIHHALAIDLGGFETLVDALGGVEVEVACPILDNFIDSRTPSGRRELNVDAGLQHMNGVTAALYARSRHGRSDFSRARRQQAVLFGIKNRFLSIDGVTRLPEFWGELSELLVSDLSRADFFSLVREASSIESNKIHGLVFGSKEVSPHYTEDGKAVLLPNFDAISSSLSGLFAGEKPGILTKGIKCRDKSVAIAR